MADTTSVTVYIRDIPALKLLIIELEGLLAELQAADSPYAARLDRVLWRFAKSEEPPTPSS